MGEMKAGEDASGQLRVLILKAFAVAAIFQIPVSDVAAAKSNWISKLMISNVMQVKMWHAFSIFFLGGGAVVGCVVFGWGSGGER